METGKPREPLDSRSFGKYSAASENLRKSSICKQFKSYAYHDSTALMTLIMYHDTCKIHHQF